jgi:hypothetical protein
VHSLDVYSGLFGRFRSRALLLNFSMILFEIAKDIADIWM